MKVELNLNSSEIEILIKAWNTGQDVSQEQLAEVGDIVISAMEF